MQKIMLHMCMLSSINWQCYRLFQRLNYPLSIYTKAFHQQQQEWHQFSTQVGSSSRPSTEVKCQIKKTDALTAWQNERCYKNGKTPFTCPLASLTTGDDGILIKFGRQLQCTSNHIMHSA
jgi:hypothetical protein